MRVLLDTHVILWRVLGTQSVGTETAAVLSSAEEVAVSVVSFAEVGIKIAIGKLAVPDAFEEIVRATGVRIVALLPQQGMAVQALPLHHRDPFDRLLVAQARSEALTLMSADARLSEYDVPVLDPRR